MPVISDKTIWLIGASSGIGRSLAIKLADMGNFVIVSARSKDKLDDLAALNPEHIAALPADISDDKSVPHIKQSLKATTDTLDIVIFAAGVVEYEDDLSFDVDMYRKVFDVNVFGMINSLAIAKPLLTSAQQRAYIVGISSQSMLIGFPRAEAYGSSKAAADYFLHSLITDIPHRKFDVSIVRPGFVETPMTSVNDFPMPFLMSADQAADRIIHGMVKRKRVIEFPRRLSWMIRLLSCFPSLWYKCIGPKTSRSNGNI